MLVTWLLTARVHCDCGAESAFLHGAYLPRGGLEGESKELVVEQKVEGRGGKLGAAVVVAGGIIAGVGTLAIARHPSAEKMVDNGTQSLFPYGGRHGYRFRGQLERLALALGPDGGGEDEGDAEFGLGRRRVVLVGRLVRHHDVL